jgi:hypothetical protein
MSTLDEKRETGDLREICCPGEIQYPDIVVNCVAIKSAKHE